MDRHLIDAVNDLGGVEYAYGVVSDNTPSCVKASDLTLKSSLELCRCRIFLTLSICSQRTLGAAHTIARVISCCKDIRNGIHLNHYTLLYCKEIMLSNNASQNKASGEDNAVQIGRVTDTRFGYNMLVMR